ncbi:glutamate--tRNA ligase [Cyanobacterium stanieri LEGE 03274]|uniref:Glutamate--tRNA ligase n=1 Tax=Cyanobacterium stanieri LEGE 03274 TaxID=1828756 RepID=A0ABR9V6D9_9CHRO|nr:glutamate--tRNA ligase [Cyanobacterium stanieri]MBE9222681.1 glutamate--tRNA ligase [Cyanobacterium stanieri LEGE 03274]
MSVRVRIAPSPTGNLHIGTARTAVFNWLYARNQKGKFILRVEDTDIERSRAEYTENIKSGLTWLGLNWDEGPFFQTERLDKYRQAIQTLIDKGLAYPCYCTSQELDEMREKQKAANQAPRYDNRHRHLNAEQIAEFEAQGKKPVIRFKIEDNQQIVWNDLVRGKVIWQGSDLGGDMVIARASEGDTFGQPLYNLAVVVDDMDMNISHVIRGEDHIANTAKQILLYQALGSQVPEFAHTPLILNPEGKKLSKRDGVTSIDDFRKMGFVAPALVNYMTLLGWTSPDGEEIFTLEEAATKFSLERVNKAGAKFDWDKLDWINSQYLHHMPPEELLTALIPHWQEAGYQFDVETQKDWLLELTALISTSLTRLTDGVKETALFFASHITLSDEAKDFVSQEGVKDVLGGVISNTPENLTEEDAKGIIKQVTKDLKVKKGLVMRSLRAGLTGELHGPDLIQSWLLLHKKGVAKTRLESLFNSL